MDKAKKTSKKVKSLKDRYCEIVKVSHVVLSEKESLEQPHAFKFVDTVTTYGAYQKPI